MIPEYVTLMEKLEEVVIGRSQYGELEMRIRTLIGLIKEMKETAYQQAVKDAIEALRDIDGDAYWTGSNGGINPEDIAGEVITDAILAVKKLEK